MIIGIDGNEANIKNRVGINQYAYSVLCELSRLREAQNHIFEIYLKEAPLLDLPKESPCWKYKILKGSKLWVLTRLMPFLLISRHRPDVLFCPTHYIPIISRIPITMSVMDLGYLSFSEQFEKADLYQLRYWTHLSMQTAKKIIAISETTKNDIVKHYPFVKNKVEVTYLGYDKQRFNSKLSRADVEQVMLKYKINKKYLLFLSTLKPSKNVDGIVEAFKLVSEKSEFKDYVLVIAGKKGWLYESIFKKVGDLGLKDKVVFTDYIDENDKPYLISGAKLFISPSFWEGFGIHVLEAMAIGIPVVVSDKGSLPEVVGDAGVLVDPYSPSNIAKGMEYALKNHELLSKKALKRADEFSWEKTALKTLKILESCV